MPLVAEQRKSVEEVDSEESSNNDDENIDINKSKSHSVSVKDTNNKKLSQSLKKRQSRKSIIQRVSIKLSSLMGKKNSQ